MAIIQFINQASVKPDQGISSSRLRPPPQVLGLGLPVAVLGNKVDRPDTLTPTELALALGLRWESHSPRSQIRPEDPRTGLWMVSVLRGRGLQEPFLWLASTLK